MDVVAIKNDEVIEVHQIGRTLADGVTPVIRERRVLRELRYVFRGKHIKRIFHSYN